MIPVVLDPKKKVPIQEVLQAITENTWGELRDRRGGLVKPDITFFGEPDK